MTKGRLALVSVTILALFVPAAALAQPREFSRTMALDTGGELRLTATKGSVTLTAWDRQEVEVRARIEEPPWTLGDDARRAVDATTVDVTGDRRAVSIRSNYDLVPPRRGSWWDGDRIIPSIHYDIKAPCKVNLRLDIDRSNTELAGFEGQLTLETDRSEVTARELRGTIYLTIDRGGRSRLSNIQGRVDLDADRTDVLIDAVRLDGDSRIKADRGDIELRISSSQPLRVRADVERRGSFRSDFPLERRGRRDSIIEGTINGGGPELVVRGYRADIELRKR